MADISVIIEVLGAKDMEKAARVTQTLQNKIQSLGKQLQKGNITNSQYQKGVQQLIKKNADAAGGYKALQGQVQRYAGTLQRQINENFRAVAAQEQVQRTVSQTSNTLRAHGNAVDEVRNQYVRMNASTFRAQQGTKRFASVGLQQAGYQIGDFIVQVQSGQSALVAFGQQGSQLAGIFGPAGAIIGAFIAAGTALGMIYQGFRQASEGAKDLDSAMDSLGGSISALEAAIASHETSLVELVDKYGVLAVQIRETQVAMAEAAAQKAFLDLQQTATLTTGIISRLTVATKNLEIAQSGAFGELPNILQSAEDPLRRAEIIVQNLSKELGLTEEQAVTLGGALRDIGDADSLEGQARAAAEVVSLLDKIPPEVKQANREFFAAIENLGKVAEQGAIAARAAEKLKESAPGQNWMDNAIKGVNSLYNRIVAAITGVQTLKSETDTGVRPRMRPMDLEDKMAEQQARGQVRPMMRPMDLTTGTLGGGGGGGGDPAQAFNSARDALASLIGQYDEGVKVAEQLRQAQITVNEAVKAGVITTEQGQTAMQGYIQSLDQAETPMKQIGETLKQSLGDAFMSIVDGSKSASDAFKDMARAVLKQAFELMVIKPILDGLFGGSSGKGSGLIGSIFGFANGGAFSNGKVTAFANGGVVNSPTIFPMANGAGLMGEAGPEAIMPLKRGKNGKLGVQVEGSQQPVVINQSFNFSANGDESVKRIIAQEAPRIANLTQKQILDQRRRGGTFKSTFG